MALVSQDNIPQSGQITKPKGNPELGNSHIQNELSAPPSQGSVDDFENPTKKTTWKSENKIHALNNGLGTVEHGVGIPDTTIAWNVSTTNQSVTMDYSPVGNSRIQQNFSNDVYHIMSPDQQRNWSGPRASLYMSEPHIIIRPDEVGAVLSGNDYIDKLQEFGVAASFQDAVRFGKHLLSPRGLQFLNDQNVMTKKNPYEEAFDAQTMKAAEKFSPRTFNPLAVYISRALPAQMVRYTDSKYSVIIDALVGATPLRSLAIEGLQQLASDVKLKFPNAQITGNLEKVATGQITLGAGVTNVLTSYIEGKAIDKAKQYGQKLFDKYNRKEKGSTVSDKNVEPTADKELEPEVPLFPSDYKENKPYVFNFTVRQDTNLWGGFGEENRFSKFSLGSQIMNWHMSDDSIMNSSNPIAQTEKWKLHFQDFGIRYTLKQNQQLRQQYGMNFTKNPVGLFATITAPSFEGDRKKYTSHIDPNNISDTKYKTNKTEEQFDTRKSVVGENTTTAEGSIEATDNTGTLVSMTNQFTTEESYDSIDKEAKVDHHHKDVLHSGVYDGNSKELAPVEAPVDNTGAKFMTKNFNHGDKRYKATGDPTLDTDDSGNVGLTQVGVNIPENKIIRKTATQTAHIDGKTPDKEGNYSRGGTEVIDKYKAHLYGELAEKRNPANVNGWGRNRIHPVTKLNHSKMGVAGRVSPGDVYLGDTINQREIEVLNSLDEPGQAADDSIVFKIKIMNTKELIVLRAFITSISDNVTPNWSSINYVGKPDPVYIYKGAERKMSVNFSLISFTKEEHTALWKKANKLVGLNYPTYAQLTGKGKRMMPPMVRLTIGDYVSDQPGFFEKVDVKPRDNSSWEVEKGKQLPHHLDIETNFTYIGDYLPDLENPKFYNVDGAQKGDS